MMMPQRRQKMLVQDGDEDGRLHLSADRTQDCAFVESIEQNLEVSQASLAPYQRMADGDCTSDFELP